MNHSKQIGNWGEKIAVDFLKNKGYELIIQNYQFKKKEIDIIMQYENILIFVEVKLRKNHTFGFPEQFVTKTKQNYIKEAAENYIFENNWQKNIRFDIIAITKNLKNTEILHIEDAFY
jgi:putative endonuclease